MNKPLDILAVEPDTPNEYLYAIVEFTVAYFKVGDFVAYDDAHQYLRDGAEEWTDDFLPSGNEIENYGGGKMEWDTIIQKWILVTENGIILDKETFAITEFEIVGNASGWMTAMQSEVDLIGAEFLNPYSQEILQIAREANKPRKKDAQYSTFLTLWRVVYDEYTSYESMYPEYDVWAELIGKINLVDLVKMLDRKETK